MPTSVTLSNSDIQRFDAMFAPVDRNMALVESVNACALPGCNIKYETFCHVCKGAMSAGFVTVQAYEFAVDGLTRGFGLGVNPDTLQGHRKFSNYLQRRPETSRQNTNMIHRWNPTLQIVGILCVLLGIFTGISSGVIDKFLTSKTKIILPKTYLIICIKNPMCCLIFPYIPCCGAI